jgi:hypothetical protein
LGVRLPLPAPALKPASFRVSPFIKPGELNTTRMRFNACLKSNLPLARAELVNQIKLWIETGAACPE